MERNEILYAIERALTEHTTVFIGSQEALGWPAHHEKACTCDQRRISPEEALAHVSVAVLESLERSGLEVTDHAARDRGERIGPLVQTNASESDEPHASGGGNGPSRWIA